jgi:hypothetical protein
LVVVGVNDVSHRRTSIQYTEMLIDEHLYIRRTDSKQALMQYQRELHVCPTLNPAGGVHLSVRLDLVRRVFGENPPPGAEGHQRQIAAGLNLTAKQARKVIKQMEAILDA